MRKNEMNAKKLLVSFLLIASVLFLATAVSAAATATNIVVSVDETPMVINGTQFTTPSVVAGETIEVDVWFTVDADESDVELKVTLEGENDVVATKVFDVEAEGTELVTYHKTLVLKVPSDLDEDEVSGGLTMVVELLNFDEEYTLNVQRPSYDFAVKSITVDSTVQAGKSIPVEVVLKNVGYNDADDVYVTVSIPELNIEKKSYFGNIVTGFTESESDDDDDTNTARLELELALPNNAKPGLYTLVVEVENDETTKTVAREITIANEVAVKSGNSLILLNPTTTPVVYKVIYNGNEVTADVSALQTRTVAIEVPEGDYDFNVEVYSGAALLSTIAFSGTSQGTVELTNPVFVLTVILSVVFLVLLVVLVVLITKKPQKAEEFGESYY